MGMKKKKEHKILPLCDTASGANRRQINFVFNFVHRENQFESNFVSVLANDSSAAIAATAAYARKFLSIIVTNANSSTDARWRRRLAAMREARPYWVEF